MPATITPETDQPETIGSDIETPEPTTEGDQGDGDDQGDNDTAEPLGAYALLAA